MEPGELIATFVAVENGKSQTSLNLDTIPVPRRRKEKHVP